MLRHSLVTLEGEQEFIDFYRAFLSREGSPLTLHIQIFDVRISYKAKSIQGLHFA